MKKTIKTLALLTATIGVAAVVKRKKEQPAGTGHSKVFYGESKPKNIRKGDVWFTSESGKYVAAFLDNYLEVETGGKKLKARVTDLNGDLIEEFYLTKKD